jgi:hypothetical protein
MARTPKTVTFEQEVSDEIVRLRTDEGYKWAQIGAAVDLPVGKCMLIFAYATTPKKLRLKDATGDQIAELRDDERLSWGQISARTGYPEGSCRSLYEQATGKTTHGNRIGKGGRLPNGDAPAPKTKASAKEKAPKSEKAPKAPATPGRLDGLTPEEVKDTIEGYAIKVDTGSGEEMLKVKAVKKVAKGNIVLTTAEGEARTIKQAAVKGVSKKKIAA